MTGFNNGRPESLVSYLPTTYLLGLLGSNAAYSLQCIFAGPGMYCTKVVYVYCAQNGG